MNSVKPEEVQKLVRLLNSLRDTMEQVGTVADEVEDRKLRIALAGLADEGCNYAEEIRSQLHAYGIAAGSGREYFAEPGEEAKEENELINLCNRFENYLSNAYRSILTDVITLPSLKELLLYQYEALKAGFKKVRLLNELRTA